MKLMLLIVGFLGIMAAQQLVMPRYHYVGTAEAVVGRPLTPVSVAGVARRDARRGY